MPPKMEDKMLTLAELAGEAAHLVQPRGRRGARFRGHDTVRFEGENGVVTGIQCVRVDEKFKPIEGTEFTLKADLVLLAMGFVSPVKEGLLAELGVKLDGRGNVAADTNGYATSLPKVFACGDMRRGQSLVVWAIREGRQCAASIDKALMGATVLPR